MNFGYHSLPKVLSKTEGASQIKTSAKQNGPEILGLFPCRSLLHNQAMIYGYPRVSTDGQSEAAQVRQLRAAGPKKVFREVASGAKTDRPQLRRLISELAAGDVVMVTRLDRLARSTRDLLNTLAAITAKKAGFNPHSPNDTVFCDRTVALSYKIQHLVRDRTGRRWQTGRVKRTAAR
jgi:predicted site-specific integrase-resolvase